MSHPEVPEGYQPGPGEPVPVRFSRSDLALLRKAASERWNVPDSVQTEAIFQLTRILASETAKERLKLAAARTLAAFTRIDLDADRVTIDRERLDLVRLKLTKPDSAADVDARAALLADAEAIVAEKTHD